MSLFLIADFNAVVLIKAGFCKTEGDFFSLSGGDGWITARCKKKGPFSLLQWEIGAGAESAMISPFNGAFT